MAHHVVDIGAASRRDDPYPSALRAELLAEDPQRLVEPHRVEEGGVEGDLPQPQPFALGRIPDPEAGEELLAAHPEVARLVLLLGERVARFGERRDVCQRVGPARVGERSVEIEQQQSDPVPKGVAGPAGRSLCRCTVGRGGVPIGRCVVGPVGFSLCCRAAGCGGLRSRRRAVRRCEAVAGCGGMQAAAMRPLFRVRGIVRDVVHGAAVSRRTASPTGRCASDAGTPWARVP